MGFVEKERAVVEQTTEPITKKRLVHDLKAIGVVPGDTVVVHSSMSKIGWVIGNQTDIVEALMEAVTEKGTLVMPAHTSCQSRLRISSPRTPLRLSVSGAKATARLSLMC